MRVWLIKQFFRVVLGIVLSTCGASTFAQTTQASATTTKVEPTTLAVFPFFATTPAERDLARDMRFAVSQKITHTGEYDRQDNVELDLLFSTKQILLDQRPNAEELTNLLNQMGTQRVILGTVQKRHLKLELYAKGELLQQAEVDIPPGNESPKLAVEKVLTDLLSIRFNHVREEEVDHSNPAVEALWRQRPNLAPDADFETAATQTLPASPGWGAILQLDRYAPPLLTTAEARKLPKDKVAIVPTAVATDDPKTPGHCLMMRMSGNIAANNGLACESVWIPVQSGQKYRFQVRYLSRGPVPRIFLKGFGVKPDKYSKTDQPESSRREYYRAQVLPRKANEAFELIEMDFTPEALAKYDVKIQWLRVDLYVYLTAGDVFFDDVSVKNITPEPVSQTQPKH